MAEQHIRRAIHVVDYNLYRDRHAFVGPGDVQCMHAHFRATGQRPRETQGRTGRFGASVVRFFPPPRPIYGGDPCTRKAGRC